MKNKFRLSIITTIACAMMATACNKNSFENKKTIKKLHRNDKSAEIIECTLEGETLYKVAPNAWDAAIKIFDKEAVQTGVCSYAWNHVDSICDELNDCEVIYRAADNIWGQPAVDKYGLGR